MKRRTLLVGVGSLTAGSAVGTGAFSSIAAGRSIAVNVAGDDAALLALEAADSPNGDGAYADQVAGQLEVHLDGEGDEDVSGVNPNAVTNVERVLTIGNQGTQGVGVYLQKEGDYTDAVTFETHDDGTALGVGTADPAADQTVDLGIGATEMVDIRVDTTGLDVDPETALLESVTFYADASKFGGSTTPIENDRISFVDEFGWSTAADGETAAIGARARGFDNQGTVYTYSVAQDVGGRIADEGLDVLEGRRSVGPGETEVSMFGHDVALDGDLLVVGAPGLEDAQGDTRGAAFIYKWTDGDGWELQKSIEGPDSGSDLGFAVAVDADTRRVVIGDGKGNVWVYEHTETDGWEQFWTQTEALGFGSAVAVDGATLVVGSPLSSKAVYVYERETNEYEQVATLGAPDRPNIDYQGFGESVDIETGRIVVGDNGASEVYVYDRNTDGTWPDTYEKYFSGGNNFGQSVTLNGDDILAGGLGAEALLETPNGSGGWTETTFSAADEDREKYGTGGTTDFGRSVAMTDDVVLISAVQKKEEDGAVYVYER